MNTRTVGLPILFCLLILFGFGKALSQALDISSGGQPTITGALGGSVTGSSNVLNDLIVTVDFGEVSPANTNSIVRVVVPIAIRSSQSYKVVASVSGSTNANLQAVQRSDIGFGVVNFRSMGANARVCDQSPHIINSPFGNNPAGNVTIDASGRAAYPSTLNNLVTPATIVSGPRLSNGNDDSRETDDGYLFNAILAITPQYYRVGSTSLILTFTISSDQFTPC